MSGEKTAMGVNVGTGMGVRLAKSGIGVNVEVATSVVARSVASKRTSVGGKPTVGVAPGAGTVQAVSRKTIANKILVRIFR